MIAITKIIGAVAAECVDVVMIVYQSELNQVIKFFVGLSIITKIDTIMALTLTTVNIPGEIEKTPLKWKDAELRKGLSILKSQAFESFG